MHGQCIFTKKKSTLYDMQVDSTGLRTCVPAPKTIVYRDTQDPVYIQATSLYK